MDASTIRGILVEGLGGLALFLFAMALMTEGLTAFAGTGLRRLLGRWTSTPLRGVAAGMLVTGMVQSSSAVTVATIGFVNAGLLNLRQALGVVYGTNVGTTMTGWLVSLVGFGFKIEAFALPMVAAGVALRLAARGARRRGLGDALVGFGLFFLGLAFLREAFSGMADALTPGAMAAGAGWMYVLVGFGATVLTQSSSAAIAMLLSAAASGVLPLESAALAVIGANLGTTSTALLAVLRATAAARRLAVAHVAFNALAALVALSILAPMLGAVGWLADALAVERSPAAVLALFHTVFNVLGVLLALPLTARLAAGLERLFRSAEEDAARPRHLDRTLLSTPHLALVALRAELARVRDLVLDRVRLALAPPHMLPAEAAAIPALAASVIDFVGGLRARGAPHDLAGEPAAALVALRELRDAAQRADALAELARRAASDADPAVVAPIRALLAAVDAMVGACAEPVPHDAGGPDAALDAALDRVEATYRAAKAALLDAAVDGRRSAEDVDAALDLLWAARRLARQLAKAGRWLREARNDTAPAVGRD